MIKELTDYFITYFEMIYLQIYSEWGMLGYFIIFIFLVNPVVKFIQRMHKV